MDSHFKTLRSARDHQRGYGSDQVAFISLKTNLNLNPKPKPNNLQGNVAA